MTSRALVLAVLAALLLGGAWSVAVFVGALDWGTPGAADPAPFGTLFRGVLYPVLAGLLLVLVVGGVLELRQRRAPAAHRRLELIWVAIPAVALLIVALGERELRADFDCPAIEILAGLEAWSGADLETTAGEPLRVCLRTSDVAHTLSAPALDLELAVLPGQPMTAHLPTQRVGEFELSCSVHGRGVGRLRVLPAP